MYQYRSIVVAIVIVTSLVLAAWLLRRSLQNVAIPQASPQPTPIATPSSTSSPEIPSSPLPDSTASSAGAPIYKNLIKLNTPQPESRITSPLVIQGEARGTWFFEASFPVVLTNWDGLIIAEGIATAEGDWMTENYVPFSAELEFIKPDYGERGSLILQKSNPSGLPEHDDALEITVFFE